MGNPTVWKPLTQFETQNVLYQECVHVAWNGNEDHYACGDYVVLPFVLFERSIDTKHDTKWHREDHCVHVYKHCCGKLANKRSPNLLAGVDLLANTKVTFHQNCLPIDEVLFDDGLVVAKLFTTVFYPGLVFAEVVGRNCRQRFDQEETNRYINTHMNVEGE